MPGKNGPQFGEAIHTRDTSLTSHESYPTNHRSSVIFFREFLIYGIFQQHDDTKLESKQRTSLCP